MMTNFDDPFEALFAIQRALDARRASDWMGSSIPGVQFPADQHVKMVGAQWCGMARHASTA
jgi:hypothetical protein